MVGKGSCGPKQLWQVKRKKREKEEKKKRNK